MYPKRNARVDHPDLRVRNVLRRGVGHMSLPMGRGTIQEVVRTLATSTADHSSTISPIPFIGRITARCGAR